MSKNIKKLSRFMSLILRHKPQVIKAELDEGGWLDVETLMAGMNAKGHRIDRATLDEVVRTNDKQRFAFSEDGTRIRANQGHSIEVAVEMESKAPPTVLYHGTVGKFIDLIMKKGLLKMSRLHVHLSADVTTATRVGSRRGFPKLLVVDAQQMHADGFEFFLSENGVWLTDHVPPEYLSFHES